MVTRFAVAIVALLCIACGGDDDPSPTPSVTAAAIRTPVPGPSQSAADAQRDGVPAEVAALPYPERVQERARMRAPEGVWMISRSFETPEGLPEELEDYAEILLLDTDETRVLRAFPFESVSPVWITLNDQALYCGREGTGRQRYTMLCRIDRTSFAQTVRIYTDRLDTWIGSEHPRHWVVIGYFLEVQDLVVDDRALYALARNDTWTWLDPNTLTVVQPGTQGPASSPRPRASANPR